MSVCKSGVGVILGINGQEGRPQSDVEIVVGNKTPVWGARNQSQSDELLCQVWGGGRVAF